MADTHTHLASLGYMGAILVPGSEALFGFYSRMGYASCTRIHEFICVTSDETVRLTQISPAEYASLRRQLLPEGGVIQEKENLDFLITQAALYKGEDFILAARQENSTLICPEILGNTAAAPMITKTLGCKSGKFRTPPNTAENSRPFAMYLPFTDEKAPSYFGLAFD